MREKGGRKGARKHSRKTLILVPLRFMYSLVAFQKSRVREEGSFGKGVFSENSIF